MRSLIGRLRLVFSTLPRVLKCPACFICVIHVLGFFTGLRAFFCQEIAVSSISTAEDINNTTHVIVDFRVGICPFNIWSAMLLIRRRQGGRVVRMPDLKSGDPEFNSRSDDSQYLFQVVTWLNSSAALVLYSQLVLLLPIGILRPVSNVELYICRI